MSVWYYLVRMACELVLYQAVMLGGEKRVIEFLENEKQKWRNQPLLEGSHENQGLHQRSFMNFFCRPYVIGSDVLTIEKFGLVQYVSQSDRLFHIHNVSLWPFSFYFNFNNFWLIQMILKTFCAFLAFLLELFGVYGDGEFKWYYGCALHWCSFLLPSKVILLLNYLYYFILKRNACYFSF